MDRRTFLATSTAGTAVGLAGCLGSISGDDSAPEGADPDADSPRALVESYYEFLVSCETAEPQFFHDDLGRESELEFGGVEATVEAEDIDPDELTSRVRAAGEQLEAIREIAATEDTAIVTAVFSFVAGDEEHEETVQWALATDDSEWALLSELRDEDEPPATAPQVLVDFSYDEEALVVTATHEGGDSIPAETLRIDGEGIESASTGPLPDIEGSEYEPGDTVSAGDSIDVAVESGGYTLEIVWEDGNHAAVLATHEGPDA